MLIFNAAIVTVAFPMVDIEGRINGPMILIVGILQ
jgi:hypothetical protein